MGNTATERMLAAVEASRARAERAEARFERCSNDVQADAERSIDLFGGSAVSRVANLASAARTACDTLYAAYQTEVKLLDEVCRPLLSQDPSTHAVREVARLIKWLNDESEIENNFTASLNSYSLGDVASVRYMPSVENKMIQSYWEGKCDSVPSGTNREYSQRRAPERYQPSPERYRPSPEERRRADAEKRRAAFAQANADKIAEQKAYQTAMGKWRGDMQKTEQERERVFQKRLESERSRLEREAQQKYDATATACNASIASLQQQMTELQRQLEGLGLFQMGEKHSLKKQIKEAAKEIAGQEKRLAAAGSILERERSTLEEAVRSNQPQLRKEVNAQLRLPEEPCPPGVTAEQFRERRLQNAIVRTLRKHGQLKLPEIREKCEEVSSLSDRWLSTLIQSESRIHSSEIKRMIFYTADAYDPGPSREEQLHKERREFLMKLIRQCNPCTQAYLERETELYLTREALKRILEELHNEGLITCYVDGNYCYEIY